MHYNKLSEILRAKNTEKVVKSCGREESMFPVYEEKKKNLHIHLRTSAHASPHLHNSIEFIYITEGTLELGMGQAAPFGRKRFQSQDTAQPPTCPAQMGGYT